MFDIWPTDRAERKRERESQEREKTHLCWWWCDAFNNTGASFNKPKNEKLNIFNGNEHFKRKHSHTQCNSIRRKKTVSEMKSKKCCEVSFWLFFFLRVTIADNYTILWKLIAVIAVGPDHVCVCSICMVLGVQLCTNALEFCGEIQTRREEGIKQQRIANIA